MKNLLLLLACFLSIHAFAQDNKFKFGVVINPAWSHNALKNDGSVPKEVEQSFKELEKRSFAYYGYGFVQYRINSRGSILAGAGYSNTSYASATQKLTFGQPEPNAPEYAKFHYTHQDIIIPILYRYNLTKGENHFYVTGGVTPQVKLSRTATRTLKYANGTITQTTVEDTATDYRKLNINGTFGFGYNLKISQKTSLFFQPTFDCNLLGTSKNASLNRRIYSVGINIGLTLG